jgi:hypothetical protein
MQNVTLPLIATANSLCRYEDKQCSNKFTRYRHTYLHIFYSLLVYLDFKFVTSRNTLKTPIT